MFLILDVCDLVVLGHGERIVDDFVVCLAVGVDIDELLPSEVIILALGTNRSLDLPCLGRRVLDGHLLRNLSPDHAIKLQLLDGLLRLRDALAYQVDIERISALNSTLDLEPNIVIGHIGVEGDREVEILMRQEIPFLGLDGEILAAEGSIPLKLRTDVSEIRQLDGFADLGINDNCAEAYGVLH